MTKNQDNILIIGAGAIGSFYGALLAKSGADVSVLCRSDYETVIKKGYSITSTTLGSWVFTPSQIIKNASEYDRQADYVILCTKNTPDTDRVQLINDIKNNTDISKTIDKLNTISKESNKSNDKGYKAFNLLSDSQKIELIEKIQIIDALFDFSCVVEKIKKELRLSVLPKNITPLFERLDGWFLGQKIKHLQDRKHHISFNELQKAILYISDKFKSDSLPIDFPDKIIKSNDAVKSMSFVKQLSLIDSTKRTKQHAISDYYRAYYQRSKWITNELLDPQEEIDFEKRLIDDWERKFDLLLDETEGKNKVECRRDAKNFIPRYILPMYLKSL